MAEPGKEPLFDSGTVAASAQGARVGRTSFPHPGPTGTEPLFDSDGECHRCGGRGCEACDYRVLVMLDVADDE